MQFTLTLENLGTTRRSWRKDFNHELLAGVVPSTNGGFREFYDPGWITTGCFISTVEESRLSYSSPLPFGTFFQRRVPLAL